MATATTSRSKECHKHSDSFKKPMSHWHKFEICLDYGTRTEYPYSIHQLFPNSSSSTVRHLPDPRLWSRSVTIAILEVLSGLRPAQQLERWLAPQIYEALIRRIELNQRLGGKAPKTNRPQIMSSRICVVNANTVETNHSVFAALKHHPVCVRLEAHKNQWIVTAVEIL